MHTQKPVVLPLSTDDLSKKASSLSPGFPPEVNSQLLGFFLMLRA